MLQTDMNVTGHFSKTYHQQELLYMLPLFVRSELTQWFCCLFKAHEMSRCAVGIRVPAVSRTAMSSSSGSISPRWETAMWKGLGTSQMWRKWCGQKDLYKGVSKSFETSSIDCQPMEVHEWVRCAWEQGTLPLSMPSGVAVWTLGVAQHECFSPRVPLHLRFQHGRETGANSAWNSANLERRLFKWYDVRMEMRPWVEDEAAAKRVAALTEWRRSSWNRRMFLVCFENRSSSMCSSRGNGAGIDVSLHKETILKGMLPKLK